MTDTYRVPWRLVCLCLCLCITLDASAQVGHLQIDSDRDTAYLPYRVQAAPSLPSNCERIATAHSLRTARAGVVGGAPAYRVNVLNSCIREDRPSHLSWHSYPGDVFGGESPVSRLHMTDLTASFDSLTNTLHVLCAALWGDSAYVLKWTPPEKGLQRVLVAAGGDKDSSGAWIPDFRLSGNCDYDYDGEIEYFFYLNSVRDIQPRVLICIEDNPLRVAWTLPVASPILDVYSCHDSVNPGVIFASSPPGQGARDSLFSDGWGYVVRVDSMGHVVFSRVISAYPFGGWLRESVVPGKYYLSHTLPISADTAGLRSLELKPLISAIDANGTQLAQNASQAHGSGLWIDSFNDQEFVYAGKRDGTIRKYDHSLQLVAESDTCEINGFIAWIPNFDGQSPALVLSERSGLVGIYSHDYRKLAQLPTIHSLDVMQRGTRGEVTALTACREDGSHYVLEIQPRGLLKRLSTFYRNNQVYFLAALFAAFTAFVVSNFYRRKTRQNLVLISSQKTQLESAHQELARTHEALKQAQATIVAQEKYRQAKDIAGGFAHEIKNALFPADTAMIKLSELSESGAVSNDVLDKYLRNINAAVSRAVKLTNLISQYTKLDSQYLPEKVDPAVVIAEVVKAHQPLLEHSSITCTISGQPGINIVGNRTQLGIVLTNLLLNAIDALTNQANRTIIIQWDDSGEWVNLAFADNGAGMPEEILPRVFDTFFSTKPNRGTGLGLSISRKIIEMYGGTIRATSQVDVGTTFELQLRKYVD